VTIQQTLEKAVECHRAGRLSEAEGLYRQVLAENPDHADALQLLGVLSSQMGLHDRARELISRAIEINPRAGNYYCNLGAAFAAEGRYEEAIPAYRRGLSLNPADPAAYNNLGAALRQIGRLDDAVGVFKQAIALQPRSIDAQNNLGLALQMLGRVDEAIATFRRVVILQPAAIDAWVRLAMALKNANRPDDAIVALERIVALQPGHVEAWVNLGAELEKVGRIEESIAALRRAIALQSDCADAHANLGAALMQIGQLDEAVAACRQAICLRADHARAHWNLSLILLLRGQYAEGWGEYEWRWHSERLGSIRAQFVGPHWDGSPLDGRRILLYAEQGLGDSIQFLRYLPMVAARGGMIVLAIQLELRRLVQSIGDVEELVTQDPIPAFDVCCALSSLPLVFGTTVDTIPRTVPYLFADPELTRQWKARLASDPRLNAGLKVGLVWGGDPCHVNDRNRSVPLAALASLGDVQNITFISLQKGPRAAEAKNPPASLRLLDFSEELQDLADTAGLIAALDLVISIDTSVAHLAGALGVPVFVLLQAHPDWRWMLDRIDSPWYPTARLFRQVRGGDWTIPVQQLSDALRAMPSSRVGMGPIIRPIL
jgi:tetratricopeptide (TPR) repeat protein